MFKVFFQRLLTQKARGDNRSYGFHNIVHGFFTFSREILEGG